MIFETKYWKLELQRIATALELRRLQKRWPKPSYGLFERDVMVGFYAIRKLTESHRLDENFPGINVPLKRYAWNGRRVGYFVWPSVEEHYDLTSAKQVHESVKELCNQVIHSAVFSPWFHQSGQLAGVFFCSDKWKHVAIYQLELQKVIELFRAAAGSRPAGWLRVAPRRNRQVL